MAKAALFLIGLALLQVSYAEESCKQVPGITCACEYGDSIVDLQELPQLSPTYSPDQHKPEYEYYFTPCGTLATSDFKDPELKKDCKDNSMCQKDLKTPVHYYKLTGKPSTFRFEGIPSVNNDGKFRIVYEPIEQDGTWRQVEVYLDCDAEPRSVFSYNAEEKQNGTKAFPDRYKFTVRGLEVCPQTANHKLSAGSVLLILFFVGIILYVVGGMLINKFVRGATGPEILPNYAFWSDFPALLKEGWTFAITCGCCKPSEENQGYDNI